jgi:hypothetical protein
MSASKHTSIYHCPVPSGFLPCPFFTFLAKKPHETGNPGIRNDQQHDHQAPKLEDSQHVDQLHRVAEQAANLPETALPKDSLRLEIQETVDQRDRMPLPQIRVGQYSPLDTHPSIPDCLQSQETPANEPSTQRPTNALCHFTSMTIAPTRFSPLTSATQQQRKEATQVKGVARFVLYARPEHRTRLPEIGKPNRCRTVHHSPAKNAQTQTLTSNGMNSVLCRRFACHSPR